MTAFENFLAKCTVTDAILQLVPISGEVDEMAVTCVS